MSLQSKTTEVLNIAEDMMTKIVRESGADVLKGLANMDEEELSMTAGMFKMYFAAKDLAEEQARVMDEMNGRIDTLAEINNRMLKRIEEQNKEINSKLSKLLESNTGENKSKKA